MLLCPICGVSSQPDVGALAAHLAEGHLLAPSEAMRRAREVREMAPDPTPQEEKPMGKQIHACSKCGSTDHNVLSPKCPEWGKPTTTAKGCGYCKRADHVYADCPTAKARRKGKRRMPVTHREPTPKPSVNGFAGALTALRVERAELDQAIAALERLEARGRL